jgi:chemotaxis protein MotA
MEQETDPKKYKRHFDPTFLLGLVIAALCIMGGLILEKGQVKDIAQVTSGLIVFGGTLGAVVVSTPMKTLLSAIKRFPSVFWNSLPEPNALIEDILRLSNVARREGLLALDGPVRKLSDPFLRKAMMLVVDANSAEEIKTFLEMDALLTEQQADEDARVFDAAGGYAPTIGIIGAVLGLMQVMKHLDNVQDVGRGIAIAFVATVYGVGIANLIFLPVASKIRTQARQSSRIREMIIEGVVLVQKGKNPRLIRQSLDPYLPANQAGRDEKQGRTPIEFTEGKKANYR